MRRNACWYAHDHVLYVKIQSTFFSEVTHFPASPSLFLYSHSALPFIYALLFFRIISNVAAGPASHIQALFDAQLVDPLMHALRHGAVSTQREAAWAVANMVIGCQKEQVCRKTKVVEGEAAEARENENLLGPRGGVKEKYRFKLRDSATSQHY